MLLLEVDFRCLVVLLRSVLMVVDGGPHSNFSMPRYISRADDAYNCFLLGRRSLLSYLHKVRPLARETRSFDLAFS